ncbi:ATP-binding protein [Allokutzneria sp. A3M-2-11 16]|nr:ATP-binding protein [Allokutzneria sp. A3M-2-11 16]
MDGSIARTIARICGIDLIVVDDIGLLPVAAESAEALCRVADAAYERRSIGSCATLTFATKGDSHRLAEALTGKGVISLHSDTTE